MSIGIDTFKSVSVDMDAYYSSMTPQMQTNEYTSHTDYINTNKFLILNEMKSIQPYSTKDEYIYAMKEDLAEWFNLMYATKISAQNFNEHLETGVLICSHANNVMKAAFATTATSTTAADVNFKFDMNDLSMASINFNNQLTHVKSTGSKGGFWAGDFLLYKPDAKPQSFQARDNISNFIKWCRHVVKVREVLMFETDDLILRKNEKHVILCLLEVARFGSKFGIQVPTIIQLEQEIEAEMAEMELNNNNKQNVISEEYIEKTILMNKVNVTETSKSVLTTNQFFRSTSNNSSVESKSYLSSNEQSQEEEEEDDDVEAESLEANNFTFSNKFQLNKPNENANGISQVTTVVNQNTEETSSLIKITETNKDLIDECLISANIFDSLNLDIKNSKVKYFDDQENQSNHESCNDSLEDISNIYVNKTVNNELTMPKQINALTESLKKLENMNQLNDDACKITSSLSSLSSLSSYSNHKLNNSDEKTGKQDDLNNKNDNLIIDSIGNSLSSCSNSPSYLSPMSSTSSVALSSGVSNENEKNKLNDDAKSNQEELNKINDVTKMNNSSQQSSKYINKNLFSMYFNKLQAAAETKNTTSSKPNEINNDFKNENKNKDALNKSRSNSRELIGRRRKDSSFQSDQSLSDSNKILNAIHNQNNLHTHVCSIANRCTCEKKFLVDKIGEGKYRIGNTKNIVFIRILRNHIMVRVGGGWDILESYLDRHDPCRCPGEQNNYSFRAENIFGSGMKKKSDESTLNNGSDANKMNEIKQSSNVHNSNILLTPVNSNTNHQNLMRGSAVNSNVKHIKSSMVESPRTPRTSINSNTTNASNSRRCSTVVKANGQKPVDFRDAQLLIKRDNQGKHIVGTILLTNQQSSEDDTDLPDIIANNLLNKSLSNNSLNKNPSNKHIYGSSTLNKNKTQIKTQLDDQVKSLNKNSTYSTPLRSSQLMDTSTARPRSIQRPTMSAIKSSISNNNIANELANSTSTATPTTSKTRKQLFNQPSHPTESTTRHQLDQRQTSPYITGPTTVTLLDKAYLENRTSRVVVDVDDTFSQCNDEFDGSSMLGEARLPYDDFIRNKEPAAVERRKYQNLEAPDSILSDPLEENHVFETKSFTSISNKYIKSLSTENFLIDRKTSETDSLESDLEKYETKSCTKSQFKMKSLDLVDLNDSLESFEEKQVDDEHDAQRSFGSKRAMWNKNIQAEDLEFFKSENVKISAGGKYEKPKSSIKNETQSAPKQSKRAQNLNLVKEKLFQMKKSIDAKVNLNEISSIQKGELKQSNSRNTPRKVKKRSDERSFTSDSLVLEEKLSNLKINSNLSTIYKKEIHLVGKFKASSSLHDINFIDNPNELNKITPNSIETTNNGRSRTYSCTSNASSGNEFKENKAFELRKKISMMNKHLNSQPTASIFLNNSSEKYESSTLRRKRLFVKKNENNSSTLNTTAPNSCGTTKPSLPSSINKINQHNKISTTTSKIFTMHKTKSSHDINDQINFNRN